MLRIKSERIKFITLSSLFRIANQCLKEHAVSLLVLLQLFTLHLSYPRSQFVPRHLARHVSALLFLFVIMSRSSTIARATRAVGTERTVRTIIDTKFREKFSSGKIFRGKARLVGQLSGDVAENDVRKVEGQSEFA